MGVVTALGLAAANVFLSKQDTDPLRLSTSGKPFDPVFILSRSVSNIICSVIFGSRFDYDDERLLTIIRFINDNFQIMSSPWGEVSTLRSDVDKGFPRVQPWRKKLQGLERRNKPIISTLRRLSLEDYHEFRSTWTW